MNLTAHLNSLLEEWSRRFNVSVPKVEFHIGISNMAAGLYWRDKQLITVNPIFTAPARENKDMLRHLEHTLAHEFGHHVLWTRYRRSASEHEANMIAKQLTGLTPREAGRLLETYKYPWLREEKIIEEELERADREKAGSGSQVPMTSSTGREGRCYELAWRHADEGTLVHGEVYSHDLRRMIDHAWVVTETGYVYEPVSNRYFHKDELYKEYKMKEINTYNPTEARKLALGLKNYGPWSDADRRKVQGSIPSITERITARSDVKPQADGSFR